MVEFQRRCRDPDHTVVEILGVHSQQILGDAVKISQPRRNYFATVVFQLR